MTLKAELHQGINKLHGFLIAAEKRAEEAEAERDALRAASDKNGKQVMKLLNGGPAEVTRYWHQELDRRMKRITELEEEVTRLTSQGEAVYSRVNSIRAKWNAEVERRIAMENEVELLRKRVGLAQEIIHESNDYAALDPALARAIKAFTECREGCDNQRAEMAP